MSEKIPSSFEDKNKEVTKNQILAVYKKFIERGITNPDDLDLADPEVIKANELFYKWQEQEDAKAAGNEDAERRLNFEKTKIYVDAGFTDRDYLEEALSWLVEDAGDLEKQIDNPERTKLRQEYAEEIRKIRNLLTNRQGSGTFVEPAQKEKEQDMEREKDFSEKWQHLSEQGKKLAISLLTTISADLSDLVAFNDMNPAEITAAIEETEKVSLVHKLTTVPRTKYVEGKGMVTEEVPVEGDFWELEQHFREWLKKELKI